ncbi:alpha/beta-hydrolase family protein [Brachybacterium sp. EF45031]|uniref:alpha/beta hydrolase n=1 Tax=Brachybacterium sillae TaxID=2810536 RepID=UPI00217E8664|nr:alpha/beta hydrolase [Brachybacterium sillae]MCS6712527.1 alpha/beta-hydrolase family protein [Brachybacterium sillae]
MSLRLAVPRPLVPTLQPTLRALRPTLSAARPALRALRPVARRLQLREITRPLDTSGFLGAAAAGWVSTSPSLIPRTWWMWAVNTGMSEIYGYATGWAAARLVRYVGRSAGVRLEVVPERRDRLRSWVRAGLVGLTAYSWVRGALRQREIEALVGAERKPLAAHAAGALTGLTGALCVLGVVRATRASAKVYGSMLRTVLPPSVAAAVAVALTTAGSLLVLRLGCGRLVDDLVASARRTNALFQPGLTRPTSPLRSGSSQSSESWTSLGAAGRRVVAAGAPPEAITRAVGTAHGRPAIEPIRVYAGTAPARGLEDTVAAVLGELERTGAFERGTIVLFTGTGTGWLQEWSLSAIEFLTGGDCATASLQYSVYPSPMAFLADRSLPRRAGALLFHAVRRRIDQMPQGERPALYVAGESLGAFGGHGAFRDLPEMLRLVDGAVWTGTPASTEIHRRLTQERDPGSPQIAPLVDGGRHVRVVTRPAELERTFWGGRYEPWEHPRIVYAQHASDPVVWWGWRVLWEEPEWIRERVGRDVTRAIRWFPWITFWQLAADMPLSVTLPGGHGHSYHQEMVPIWAAVLAGDPRLAPALARIDQDAVVRSIREHALS